MKLPEIRRYEMLVRVRDFGAAHGDVFPASSLEGETFAAVGTAVADLSQETASQVSGRAAAREGTSSKAAAREALRDTLDAISRTARALWRADIWAFGAVLYEMLTGARAFEGEDIADTLGNVMKVEPNWQRVPGSMPPRVVQVLRACLQKNPKQRTRPRKV